MKEERETRISALTFIRPADAEDHKTDGSMIGISRRRPKDALHVKRKRGRKKNSKLQHSTRSGRERKITY
jgi:hypothetical protein